MKIKPTHYARLRDAIQANLLDPEPYIVAGLSQRYRWDCLHACGISVFGNGVGTYADINLYAYLDDTHIETALRNIFQDIKAWPHG
jgi:hypothetical protein